MYNIIIVEDHILFRMGIKYTLSSHNDIYTVVGEVGNGAEFFELLLKTKSDIVLLDIGLPDISGIEIVRRLKDEYPQMKILSISVENSMETVKKLVEMDIDGFISKQQSNTGDLIDAINSIMNGEKYFGRDIAALIYDIFITKKYEIHHFTKREKEVIALCQKGLQCKEIANQLNVSKKTIENHKANIFKKLNINNTVELVNYALKNGLIDLYKLHF